MDLREGGFAIRRRLGLWQVAFGETIPQGKFNILTYLGPMKEFLGAMIDLVISRSLRV